VSQPGRQNDDVRDAGGAAASPPAPHRTLHETLNGARGHVPAELLCDSRVCGDGVALYALIRCLGPGRDTFRRKDSLAKALGWSEAKIHRVAKRLDKAGWLTRETKKRGRSWTSTWSVKALNSESLRFNTLRSEALKSESRRASDLRQESSASDLRQENHPSTIENHPRVGLDSRGELLTPGDALRCLTSFERSRAPDRVGDLQAALGVLLARRRGPAKASLICAFWDRIRSRESLRGVRSLEALLSKAAKARDPEADAIEVATAADELARNDAARAEREAQERSASPAPPPDPEVLARLSGLTRAHAANERGATTQTRTPTA
tara:strand:- start:39 stop:1007 length:969 start_codon:yes stop_codon:yes gene_type:complete